MLLLRISLVLCIIGVVRIQADPGPEKSNNTDPSVRQTSGSTPTIVLTAEKSSKASGNTTENAPLVFPLQGFTTLNKTLEKFPSNYTRANTTKNINNNTISIINNKQTSVNTTSDSKESDSSFTTSNEIEQTTPTSPPLKTTDTEVSDLQNVPTPKSTDSDLLPVPPKIIYKDNIKPDKSILLIDDGQNTEDEIRAQKSVYQEPHVALVQGQMAAILAGVFLCISVVGYVAMLSWRRYLENRYGNREMLVNEFEFDEREDMKYFSI